MVAVVFVPELDELPQSYGDIVIVGGGCYGSYYVRQLHRARQAGVVSWERIVVVDRNPENAVAMDESYAEVVHVTRDWSLFFGEYLAAAAGRESAPTGSGGQQPGAAPDSSSGQHPGVAPHAIVPSPLMPHLMSEWVVSRARARWPERTIRLTSLEGAVDVPWQRAGKDGSHYVSFATWECPINCVEPRTCPHTRGPRSWSLPPTLRTFVEVERLKGRKLEGPAVFHCEHRAYGVGMFDVGAVVEADRLVARAGESKPAEILLGTVSHCHGALTVLELGPPLAD